MFLPVYWGQLPPVIGLPLYTKVSESQLSDLGSANYHLFNCVNVLDQVMRQFGQGADQELFCKLLLHLRNTEMTLVDWSLMMKQTPGEVGDLIPFKDALHLYPTAQAVAEHNFDKLHVSGQPIAMVKAIYTCPAAAKTSTDYVS